MGFGGVTPQKTALKGGGHLKKSRHVKYYLYWKGGRGKKSSYLGGGSCKILPLLEGGSWEKI